MEHVRKTMKARNKLVIVRDADEALRIPLSKRKSIILAVSIPLSRVSCFHCSRLFALSGCGNRYMTGPRNDMRGATARADRVQSEVDASDDRSASARRNRWIRPGRADRLE